MFVGSGESMVARLKLERKNGRAPPRVEPAAQCAPSREKPKGLTDGSFLILCCMTFSQFGKVICLVVNMSGYFLSRPRPCLLNHVKYEF